jgi:putative PEP-CTERM system TPR-repeat lipoprotein
LLSATLVIAGLLGCAGLAWLGYSIMVDRAKGRYEEALTRFQAGDYRTAAVILDGILAHDSNDLPSMVLSGRAYLKLGYAARAETSLRHALGAGAHPSLVSVPLAQAYLAQSKFGQLFDELPATVEDLELRGQLLLVHGNAYLELRQFDRAERAFKQAQSLLADHPGALVGQAVTRLRRGDLDAAERLAGQASATAPESGEVWYVKAEIRRAKRDAEGAVAAYGQALEREPGHLSSRLGRAAVLIGLDRDQQAMEDLKAVWELRPDDPQANYHYALILTKLGQLDKAEQVIERAALSLMGFRTDYVMRHPPSLLLMGMLHFRNQNFDQALPLLDRYVQLEPDNPGARKLLGSIMLIRELPTAALSVMTPAMELTPDDPELLSLLAQAHTQARRHEEAAELLRRAVAASTAGTDKRSYLALSRLAARSSADGERELDAALDLGAGEQGAGVLLEVLRARGVNVGASLETVRVLARDQTDSAYIANLHGALALRAGEFEEARTVLLRALELDAGNAAASRNLARLDLETGDLEAARARLEAVLQQAPEDAVAMVVLARLATRQRRYDEAVTWLEKAAAADPGDLPVALELVDRYLKRQRLADALEQVQSLSARFPDSIPVRIARGRVELASGNQDKASATFREITAQASSSERLFNLVRYQLAGDDVEGARASVSKILENDPGFLPAYQVAVEVNLRDGNPEAALAMAAQLREQRPDESLGDRLYGDALAFMGRHADAAQAYRAGLDKADDEELMVRLHRTRTALGEVQDSVRELERWVAGHPDDMDVLRELAYSYLRLERIQPALEAHQRLLRDFPDDPRTLSNLARLYLRLGDPRARELAERAYELDSRDPSTLDTLGWMLVESGEVDRGLRRLREAQNRAAREPRIRFHVAAALSRLGRKDEARRELRRVLAESGQFEGAEQARQLLHELGG